MVETKIAFTIDLLFVTMKLPAIFYLVSTICHVVGPEQTQGMQLGNQPNVQRIDK